MNNIQNSQATVKKEKRRLYRKDITAIHRKESNRQSRKRKATVILPGKNTFSYMLFLLQIMKLIMFQTYLGEEKKFTCREWLVNDLNKLRGPDEKPMSPRSIQRPLSQLCKVKVNDIPLIVNSPEKARYIDDNHDVRFKTLGIILEIPSIENMLYYYAIILANYLTNLRPELPREEIQKKVVGQMKEFILIIDSEKSKIHVGQIALLPVDNLCMWDKLRCNVGLLALECRTNCAFYTNTLTNTKQIQNIPSLHSGVSLNVREEEGIREAQPDPREIIRKLAIQMTGGVIREGPPPDQPKEIDYEPGYNLDPTHSEFPEELRKAVNIKMKEHESRFGSLKCDKRRYHKAVRDICGLCSNALKGDLNAPRAQILGAAGFAVEEYLRMAELNGFDRAPVYWKPESLERPDKDFALKKMSELKNLLR